MPTDLSRQTTRLKLLIDRERPWEKIVSDPDEDVEAGLPQATEPLSSDEWQPSAAQIDAWCGDGKTAGGVPVFTVLLWREAAANDLRKARRIILSDGTGASAP